MYRTWAYWSTFSKVWAFIWKLVSGSGSASGLKVGSGSASNKIQNPGHQGDKSTRIRKVMRIHNTGVRFLLFWAECDYRIRFSTIWGGASLLTMLLASIKVRGLLFQNFMVHDAAFYNSLLKCTRYAFVIHTGTLYSINIKSNFFWLT